MEKENLQKISEEISQRFNERIMASPTLRDMFARIAPRSASYKFYRGGNSFDRYFYTTRKINHKGSARYVAGIYRYRKTKNDYKLVKSVGFAKKHRAIEWARNHAKIAD